ncbi:MAG: hypothetical protein WBF42_06995 [Terracidiphilus sp.]
MTGSRNKNAWIWVAIAAISLASVSRTAGGLESARAYANPVLHFPVLRFLVKSYSVSAVANSGPAVRFAQRASLFRDAGTGAWIAFLPVCFVGLVALNLISARFRRTSNPLPATPLLAVSFERPPPVRSLPL